MSPAALPDTWRERAADLRRWAAAEGAARALEAAADELEGALRAAADETLTLTQASRESGYSARRLRELIADGTIPQAGRKGAPRIRRGDLPVRPGHTGSAAGGYDPAEDARQLVQMMT